MKQIGKIAFALAATVIASTTWAKSYTLTVKSTNTSRGTVSGGGKYAAGKKLTVTATAKNGNVFAGWFSDKKCTKPLNMSGDDYRSPTVKYVMTAKNTTVYAKFVTKADAKKSLKFSSATKKLAKTPAKATAGAAFSRKLGISSVSLPTVTAKGLPKGFTVDKTTGEITGKSTKPGSYTATVTVTDAAGNKVTQKVKITVKAPSWASGTFYGTAKPGKKKSDPAAYLQFTVGTDGKVSGKMMYKGKAYSFKTSYSSCTASIATFTPKVKVGSSTFKPGKVTVKSQKVDGLSLVEASNAKGTFAAQKKPNLVKKGKALAKLVGKTFAFTKKDKNSGLAKSKDKLSVTVSNGDSAKVTGTVNGKKLSASLPLLVSGKETVDGVTTYTLYVDIIEPSLKYERTLAITVTVNAAGKVSASAAFTATITEEDLGGVQLWENGPYWAECNVGATKPEEFGYYFWWGDTVGYTRSGGIWEDDADVHGSGKYSGVTWVSSAGEQMSICPFTESCPTWNKSDSELQSMGYIDSTGNLVAAHDAATAHLGAPWRMPTSAEIEALVRKCTTTWITTNGVNGRLVTGKGDYADRSIFLPAAGIGYESLWRISWLVDVGSYGHCWSSTPNSYYPNYAWNLYFHSDDFYRYDIDRCNGQSVRAVRGFAP